MVLLRSLGVASLDTFLAAAAAFALSLQLRATHDPMLGQRDRAVQRARAAPRSHRVRALPRYRLAAVVRSIHRRSSDSRVTYEANPPLVLAFAALHLGRHPWRLSSWKPVFPILAIGAAMTLLSAYMHRHASFVVEGYQESLDPILGSDGRPPVGLGDSRHLLPIGFPGLLTDPTRAELFAAFWRGPRVNARRLGASGCVVLLRRRFRRTPASRPPGGGTSAAALQIAGIGIVMMTCSGLYLAGQAASAAHLLGGGHLATFAGTIGFVFLAVAAGLTWAGDLPKPSSDLDARASSCSCSYSPRATPTSASRPSSSRGSNSAS